MTSNDNFITVEIFNNGIQEIKTELQNIKSEMLEIKAEVKQIENQQLLTDAKIEWLQHSIYWSFAVIGIVIALVGLKPFKKEKAERAEDLSERNIRDIRSIIREEIAMARNVANV